MARIETCWRCPVCKSRIFASKREAEKCAKSHVYQEQWAVSEKFPGKAVKITRRRNAIQALREAEESDNIEEKNRRTNQGFLMKDGKMKKFTESELS